jgi:UDP-N-acetylenolpyruvoylglucosamine reductase
MSLTVAVLLSVGAIVFTLLVRGKDIPEAPPVSPVQHLEERKAQIYDNLRDLQFEYRVGKFSDEDYQKTKLDLQKELAKVMAEIDAIQPQQAKAAAAPERKPKAPNPLECPHCGAKFPVPMKFCGACGKAMA